ncbi:MAG TPA: hypothetical protein VHE35_29050 [Kofleriaceae bacterium]|nr:hypothetical protein [Kofleriaceae bacterium]
MKTRLPLVLGALFGFFALAEFYVPHHAVGAVGDELRAWAGILFALAYVLGAINIIQVTWPKVRRREPDWQYKVVMLAAAGTMVLVGIPWQRLGGGSSTPVVSVAASADGATGVQLVAPDDVMVQVAGVLQPAAHGARPIVRVDPGQVEVRLSRRVAGYTDELASVTVAAGQVATVRGDPPLRWGKDGRVFIWIYDHVFAPCNATMFALLAFFVASAAFRAFRARNVEAALLLATAILMMLGRAPIGRAISGSLPDVAQWLLDVPSNGGRRAIMMGAAIGAIATGLRIILGLERSHLGGD